ncbi:MAG TPA: hypothetical protein VM282_14720 [Acidimicrobiales bacterium]|nr:hypothetical protein [Acidimicrobiales bacterium]
MVMIIVRLSRSTIASGISIPPLSVLAAQRRTLSDVVLPERRPEGRDYTIELEEDFDFGESEHGVAGSDEPGGRRGIMATIGESEVVDHTVDLDYQAQGRVEEVHAGEPPRLVGDVELCLQIGEASLSRKLSEAPFEVAIRLALVDGPLRQEFAHSRDAAATTAAELPEHVMELGGVGQPV